jgi:predicted DNA binding protein
VKCYHPPKEFYRLQPIHGVTAMYQATLHLQLDKPCILSQLANEFNRPLDIDIEELHDHKVTFILDGNAHTDEYYNSISLSDVHHVERLDSNSILVTKPSCGAYSAVYNNHGILRRQNRVSASQRTYNILTFRHTDIRNIIKDFREIGTVTLGELAEFGNTASDLTTRQREVIEIALEEGYFQWPRGITSDELADQLGISRPTCLEHLRKAEQTLLKQSLQNIKSDDRNGSFNS